MIYRTNTQNRPNNVLNGVELYEGTSLIEELAKKKENGEKPAQIHDIVFTEKSMGVLDSYNIRADRFEIGQKRAEQISKYKNAKAMRDQVNGEPVRPQDENETIEVKQNNTSAH